MRQITESNTTRKAIAGIQAKNEAAALISVRPIDRKDRLPTVHPTSKKDCSPAARPEEAFAVLDSPRAVHPNALSHGSEGIEEKIFMCLLKHPGETVLTIARSRDGQQLARVYLSRAATIRNEIALKLARMDDLRARSLRVSAFHTAHAPSGGVSDPVGEAAQSIADLETETLEGYRCLTEAEKRLSAVLDRIGNATYRLILHMHYLDGVKFSVIGMRIGFGEKHVYKLHGKALSVVALILLSGERRLFDSRVLD